MEDKRGESRMKDSCSSVSKLLEKYFDQEVTDKERSFIESHLRDCLTCQGELRSMEKLRDLVKPPIEEAVREEELYWVWQKIKREIQLRERSTWWESLRSWLDISPLFRRRVWIPVAATMVILIVMVPLLFKKITSYPGPSVVEYIESQTYNVMVYESENTKVTVIWLFEEPEKETPSS
jgi:anti-sigma-K factor RskA